MRRATAGLLRLPAALRLQNSPSSPTATRNAIERGRDFHPVPRGEDLFQAGDSLVVFGRAESIDHLFEPTQTEALGVVETEETLQDSEAGGSA